MTDRHANPLLTGIDLKPGLRCRNRIAMAATTHHAAANGGSVEDQELSRVTRRSRGPGIVFTTCVSVSPDGESHVGEPAAYDDSFPSGLARWARAIKGRGARAILQTGHGGGGCPPRPVPSRDVVSPGGSPSRGEAAPGSLTGSEIVAIIDGLAQSTSRAIKAGFDGIEIHGGHGSLPQQFLSARTNRRDDRWGGSWERRCAFPLTLLQAAKSTAWDNARATFAVGYRFALEDGPEDGRATDEAVAFVEALIDAGTDYIDVLVDDDRSPPRRGRASRGRSRLAAIADAVAGRVPLLAGGSISTEGDARDALATGIDIVTLGGALVIEPEWVRKVASGNAEATRTGPARTKTRAPAMPDPFWQKMWDARGSSPGTG